MKKKHVLTDAQSLSKINRQGGWTFWSLVFTLSVLAFFSYIAMQLVPIYNTNSNIKNAMKRSVEGVDVSIVGRSEIVSKISKQLLMDSSLSAINLKKDLKIKRSRTLFTVQVKYERRFSVVGNLDIVAKFNPTIECSFSGKCILK